ncbi:MAG: hypothetical protein ACREO3_06665, partial [Arenimonas sp.]
MLSAFVANAAAPAAPDPFAFVADALDTGDFVGEGVRQEVVISADFNADGETDVAMVARNEDRRVLLVLLGKKEGGLRRIGIAELDPYPLGEAQLKAPKGVLVIEDLTGGTTAIQSTCRYRYDKATDRMRLIGDDASLYSRTWQHGTTTVSTNRLTGKRITTINDLVGEGENATLGPDKATRSTVPTESRIYLGEAPTP